jgi:hypothetical protein
MGIAEVDIKSIRTSLQELVGKFDELRGHL